MAWRKNTLLLLILTVTTCSGIGKHWRHVNLERQAWVYIDRLNTSKHNIVTWSLTENCTYWEKHNKTKGMHPIQAQAKLAPCKVVIKNKRSLEGRSCIGVFMWRWRHTIESPFHLPVTVHLPILAAGRLPPRMYTIDLNNLTQGFTHIEKWGPNASVVGPEVFKRECKITAKATFKGYFVYAKARSNKSDLKWRVVGAGMLHNASIGLTHIGRRTLSYDLKGLYNELLMCHKRNKKH
uniref:Uncharacterized protein n=1 Tax=Amblyomma maculatum TaxID=34609 RepID=G3ML67_AMBMU